MHPICLFLSLSFSQITFVTRVIDAEQYNAAVFEHPEHCPLIAAGDLRSGRQALAAPLDLASLCCYFPSPSFLLMPDPTLSCSSCLPPGYHPPPFHYRQPLFACPPSCCTASHIDK